MPKMKTKSGAKKRFKVTGSGKVMRAAAFHNHLLEHKSAKQGRRLRKVAVADATNQRQLRRMLLV